MLLRQANSGAVVRGNADGDALIWNATAGEWFPGPSGGAIRLNGLSQVGIIGGAPTAIANGSDLHFIGDTVADRQVVGNALRCSFTTAVQVTTGEGVPDCTFALFIDGAPDSSNSGASIAAITGVQTVAFDVWVTGLDPGLHQVEIRTTSNQGGGGTVTARNDLVGTQLWIEDWSGIVP